MYTNGETVGEQRTMAAIQAIASSISEIELRDLFAMSAMQGYLSKSYFDTTKNDVPSMAYEMADKMLKARRIK